MLSLTLVAAGCTSNGSPPPSKKADGVPVTVASVVQKDVPVEIQVIGNVEAYSTVTIKAQVTGQLTKVYFQEGEYVKKGDLLFAIDPRPLEAMLTQMEANVAQNQAQLGQAQSNLRRDMAQEKYVKSQAERYARLFQEGIVSKDQSEQMAANADALSQSVSADRAAVQSARAAVGATQAAMANAKLQLAYTTIRSPIDGRAGYLMVKQGNLITANVTDLITINEVQPIFVTFAVPEDQLAAIKQYMARGKLPVTAIPQDGSSVPETGALTSVDNTVDLATGTIKLKATFANPGRRLWPGQFIRVVLTLTTEPNAMVVPTQAVQTGQEGPFVYVVTKDHTVESRAVVTGAQAGQDMVVQKGLAPGETVVTEGHLRLAPGMRVQIKKAEASTRPGKGA